MNLTYKELDLDLGVVNYLKMHFAQQHQPPPRRIEKKTYIEKICLKDLRSLHFIFIKKVKRAWA